jgi:hypothetical protein
VLALHVRPAEAVELGHLPPILGTVRIHHLIITKGNQGS